MSATLEKPKSKVRKNPIFRPSDFNNTATLEETREAYERLELAMSFAATQAKFVSSFFASVPYQVPTTDVDTFAVTLSGDGARFLLYNPIFLNSLETEKDVLFISLHESLHLLLRHMQRDEGVRGDKVWTMACEIVINAVCQSHMGWNRMPKQKVKDEDGNEVLRPTGIDPRETHAMYVKSCQKAGLTHVDYATFTESEQACYSELKRLPEPPQPPNPQGAGGEGSGPCVHMDDNGDGSPSESGIQMDQETVDELTEEALRKLVTQARQGDKQAREEILKLADMTEAGNEQAQKMWGLLGLGGIRGKTDSARKVSYWKQYLREALTSRLDPGTKLVIPRKRTGITMTLGLDPVLMRRGMERRTVVDIHLDTSGSMPNDVISWVADLVGEIPGCYARWYMFDGVVMKLVPGETVMGGGGTNFQNCVDVSEGNQMVPGDDDRDGEPDAIIMLTDGYATHVAPQDPEKWIWLITKGGDTWPESAPVPMKTIEIDTTD